MGLFTKSKPKDIPTEERQSQNNNNTEDYTVPVGLSFILNRNNLVNAEAVSAFFGGLELISNSVAGVPIVVKSKKTKEVVSHPIDLALKNGLINKFMLIKQLIQDAYKFGNGYAYIKRASDGTPIELIYRPHGAMSAIYNDATRQLYYLDAGIKRGKIEPINVIHILKNTRDGIVGVGLPVYAAKILGLASATDSAAKDFFDSGCNLSGVLKSSKPLSSTQKLDILNSWHAAFNGSQGSNVGVLGNDLDYQSVGVKASEAQMIESRAFNVLEVCRYLNISPVLLGVQGSNAYNTIEQANLDLIIHTLLPLINILQEEFNRKLLKPSETDLYIDFDEDKIAFTSKTDTANYLATLTKNGLITINEARERLSLTPMEGGDELLIPFTDVAQNTIGGNKNNDEEDGDNK